MRMKAVHRLSALALIMLFSVLGASCASQQQQQQDGQLDVTQQQGEQDQQLQQGQEQEGDQQYAQQGELDQEYLQQGQEDDEDLADENLGDENLDEEVAELESETENDLQEIIEEMNNQQVADQGVQEQEIIEEVAPLEQQAYNNQEVVQSAPVAAAVEQSSASVIPFQSGGTPAAPGLPEWNSKMPYVVQPGDTLAKISMKVYGDMNRWRQMADLTGLNNPSRIYPGDVVYYQLDQQSLAFASAYENVQRSEEVIQPGDTLAKISKRVYGTSKGWKSIWRHNDNIDNPDVLQAGSVVYYIQGAAFAQAIELEKSKLYAKSVSQKTMTLAENSQMTEKLVL